MNIFESKSNYKGGDYIGNGKHNLKVKLSNK